MRPRRERLLELLEEHAGVNLSLTIDHLCNVRTCVNPAHMEPVTVGENLRRMHRRRRGEAA